MTKVYRIEHEDAVRFRKSIDAVTKRMTTTFEKSNDLSYRKWVNTHGPVLDELREAIGGRPK